MAGKKPSVGTATLAGALVGMSETVLHNPFEVVKVRLQAKEFAHCKNTWDCAGEMLRLEGPRSFYRGFEVRPCVYFESQTCAFGHCR